MRKINESFICVNCKKYVPEAQKTCRNHCPFCLTSMHVDGDIPGDRATKCGGVMVPIEYKVANGQEKLLFICTICKKQHRNKILLDDEIIGIFNSLINNKEKYM